MNTPEHKLDEYTRQLQIQNAGGTCEHCGSALGHFNICKLMQSPGTVIDSILDTVDNVMGEEKFYRPEQVQEPDVLADVATDAAALRTLFFI